MFGSFSKLFLHYIKYLKVKAVAAGVDNLIKCEDFARDQVKETTQEGGGGVNSAAMKWKIGEMEFEAYMRFLDSMVCSRIASSVKPTVSCRLCQCDSIQCSGRQGTPYYWNKLASIIHVFNRPYSFS